MKYLSDYMSEKQSKAIEDAGAFFAFSNKQFDESKEKGVKYVNCGMGMVCPESNALGLMKKIHEIYHEAIKEDIAENGLTKIIIRELNNHEAYYTMSLEETAEALKDYPVTIEDIQAVYRNKNHELEQIVPANEVPA